METVMTILMLFGIPLIIAVTIHPIAGIVVLVAALVLGWVLR